MTMQIHPNMLLAVVVVTVVRIILRTFMIPDNSKVHMSSLKDFISCVPSITFEYSSISLRLHR